MVILGVNLFLLASDFTCFRLNESLPFESLHAPENHFVIFWSVAEHILTSRLHGRSSKTTYFSVMNNKSSCFTDAIPDNLAIELQSCDMVNKFKIVFVHHFTEGSRVHSFRFYLLINMEEASTLL